MQYTKNRPYRSVNEIDGFFISKSEQYKSSNGAGKEMKSIAGLNYRKKRVFPIIIHYQIFKFLLLRQKASVSLKLITFGHL